MKIPDKLFFKIGEVAHLTGLKPHVLRYWESEFRELTPQKSRARQRLYRKRDVEKVLKIKQLLYFEGYTIEGARKKLRKGRPNRLDQLTLLDLATGQSATAHPPKLFGRS